MADSKGSALKILTITSMKGGVGKTTISAMLARYAIDAAPHPVLVVDLDPQAGISSLLLGGKIRGPTTADVLDSETRGTSSVGLFQEAVRPSRYSDQILVVPSGADLARFAAAGNSNPPDLLARAFQGAPIPANTLVIVDTGTSPGLVRLGIPAASVIVIPIMLSQQTARPTINTLVLASRAAGCRGALAPVGMGKTQWENRELDRWREQLLGDQALAAMGFGVLPPLPHSKTIVRGRWRNGTFPQRFEPFFDALYSLAVDIKRMRPTQGSSKPSTPSAVDRSSSGAEPAASKQEGHFAPKGLPHGA
jgi:hypothetical protein